MADIKIPGIGPVDKKALIAASAVGGIVLVYAYTRRSKTAGAAPAAADATQDPTAPDTTSEDFAPDDAGLGLDDTGALGDSSIDPVTGFPYGSPQDLDALGAAGGDGTGTVVTTTPVTSQTPGEWEAAAIADLRAAGVSAAVLTAAENGLPRYLAGLTLNAAQASAVQIAVGLAGPPPGGPYPIKRAPAPPAGSGTAAKPDRQVATGTESLDLVATKRKTTAAHIIAVTQGSAEISTANRQKFDAYVAAGTGKKMPKGLVYYTTHK